jgi:hypothetical protein
LETLREENEIMNIRALTVAAAAGLVPSALAGGPEYSNTLGVPGLSGSYCASFVVWDDGGGDDLYATGSFTIPGVSGGQNLARWQSGAWTSVGGGLVNQFSNALAVYQGDLIAAGYFDSAGGVAGTEKLARFDGTEWHSMDAQAANFLNSMWDLAVWDDGVTGEQLYIAGNYADLGGDPALDHIAKWDGNTYSAVGGTIGGAGVPLIVLDLLPADLGGGSRLFAAGRFLTIGGVNAANIGVWNGTAWAPLGGGLTKTAGVAQVLHMVAWDDGNGMALYAGGSFNRADGTTEVLNVAKWDGSSWHAMGAGLDSSVQELVVFDDGSGEALYALGNFANSGATPVAHIARWSGTAWEPVGAGADGNIIGAIVYDYGEGDALVLGGGFDTLGGAASHKVGALLAGCLADFTGDGVLDFFDVQDFLAAFSAGEDRADINNDNTLDFFDVAAYLQAFSDGCP